MTRRIKRLFRAVFLVLPVATSRRARRTVVGGAVAAAAIAVPLAGAAQADAKTYYVMLQAEHSKMFVTVPNWTTEPEAAFQWYNADWPESQFILEGRGGSPGGGWSGYFRLRDRWNNLCLDLENNQTAAGTRVVQMPCDGTISQDWTYNSQADAGSQFYRHIKNRYSGLVMDVGGASTAAGAQIVTWPRHYPAQKHQRFNILGGVDEGVAASGASQRASESELQR
jgi:Ricin-type beta-trefoil lectin domain-like